MSQKYACLRQNTFSDREGYQITALRSEDFEKIRQWRNSQKEILRQKDEISAEAQQRYFRETISLTYSQKEPLQILFSFLYQGDCIGYGGLTYIDWEAKRTEVSFLVDPKRAASKDYAEDHHHFLALLCEAAFKDLKLHRLFTETFQFRKQHIRQLEDFGFKREGVLREHVFKQGTWQDSIIHGLLAQEYASK